MATVAVLMLGFFGFLVLRASSPQLAPLYTGLSLEDSSAVTKQLQTMNIPFELRGDGDTIMIARDQITTVRMSLAGDGLPSHGQVGYEIFDQQNALGATSFVQNINNVRALEGELSRTITSLSRIKTARVHLVLPERQLFQRDKQDPTASIVLAVRGQLSAGEIHAIQQLVASAVEGLTPNRVSIVDDAGELLASGAGSTDGSVTQGETDERTAGVEDRLRTRVEDILTNIVGAGRARVQVNAELNMDRSTKTSETFDPNGQVVRSTQTRDLQNSATGPGDAAVSVANQLPGATQNAGTAGSNEQGKTTEETTNYEVSKTTQVSTTDAGGIKKLSVAVVVDGLYTDDGKGHLTYAARPQADLDRIKALVQSAVGFDTTRGDTVQVVNMQFAEKPQQNQLGTDSAGIFNFTRDDLINGAQMLVTLLISLALIVFIMRPLLRRVLTPEAPPLALPPPSDMGMHSLVPAGASMDAVAEGEEGGPNWMNSAKQLGEAQMQTIKTVGTLVEENPKQAALIVRDWLNNAA
jgi:flagellar M-ring protein FliF